MMTTTDDNSPQSAPSSPPVPRQRQRSLYQSLRMRELAGPGDFPASVLATPAPSEPDREEDEDDVDDEHESKKTRRGSYDHAAFAAPDLAPAGLTASYAPFAQRMTTVGQLRGHTGCVNSVYWSEHGEWVVTGSDDLHIKVWDGETFELVNSFHSGHRANIFSVKFVPNSGFREFVSCGADGMVHYNRISESASGVPRGGVEVGGRFPCHDDMTNMVEIDARNDRIFYSCSEDGRVNRYDLREATSCACGGSEGCRRHTLIDYAEVARARTASASARGNASASPRASAPTSRFIRQLLSLGSPEGVSCIARPPALDSTLATATNDDRVSLFDLRMPARPFHVWTPPYAGTDRRLRVPHKITDLRFDPRSDPAHPECLVSVSEGDLYLLRPPLAEPASGADAIVQRYRGHRNSQTMIKEANFFGTDRILSGSDDGLVYVWDRNSARLLDAVPGDGVIVNSVQPHPHFPYLLTSGIDNSVKILQPVADPVAVDVDVAADLHDGLDLNVPHADLVKTLRTTRVLGGRAGRVAGAVWRNLVERRGHADDDFDSGSGGASSSSSSSEEPSSSIDGGEEEDDDDEVPGTFQVFVEPGTSIGELINVVPGWLRAVLQQALEREGTTGGVGASGDAQQQQETESEEEEEAVSDGNESGWTDASDNE
ncbi:DDB1- and CUL4-associated factor 6 [Blastocladiella emersonii ATCC 22665]|nr:DDB1- and CUL4-associated factor 6 [Blastocladiella emersonii ATCC 22665]